MSIATTYSGYSFTWWTPDEWIDWVTATLGEGWTDPCPRDWDGVDRPDSIFDSSYWNYPGTRGGVGEFWRRCLLSVEAGGSVAWCAFSSEQPRHMVPSPYTLPGWLVMPRARIGFIWGGPDMVKVDGKLIEQNASAEDLPLARTHGEACRSPGNWTIFWTNREPAEPPEECTIVRTGCDESIDEARRWAMTWKERAIRSGYGRQPTHEANTGSLDGHEHGQRRRGVPDERMAKTGATPVAGSRPPGVSLSGDVGVK